MSDDRIDRLRERARSAWPGVGGIDVETQIDQHGVHSVVVSFEPDQDVFVDLFVLSGSVPEWVLADAEVCIDALARSREVRP